MHTPDVTNELIQLFKNYLKHKYYLLLLITGGPNAIPSFMGYVPHVVIFIYVTLSRTPDGKKYARSQGLRLTDYVN